MIVDERERYNSRQAHVTLACSLQPVSREHKGYTSLGFRSIQAGLEARLTGLLVAACPLYSSSIQY